MISHIQNGDHCCSHGGREAMMGDRDRHMQKRAAVRRLHNEAATAKGVHVCSPLPEVPFPEWKAMGGRCGTTRFSA